jgi:hypothetical protein
MGLSPGFMWIMTISAALIRIIFVWINDTKSGLTFQQIMLFSNRKFVIVKRIRIDMYQCPHSGFVLKMENPPFRVDEDMKSREVPVMTSREDESVFISS